MFSENEKIAQKNGKKNFAFSSRNVRSQLFTSRSRRTQQHTANTKKRTGCHPSPLAHPYKRDVSRTSTRFAKSSAKGHRCAAHAQPVLVYIVVFFCHVLQIWCQDVTSSWFCSTRAEVRVDTTLTSSLPHTHIHFSMSLLTGRRLPLRG